MGQFAFNPAHLYTTHVHDPYYPQQIQQHQQQQIQHQQQQLQQLQQLQQHNVPMWSMPMPMPMPMPMQWQQQQQPPQQVIVRQSVDDTSVLDAEIRLQSSSTAFKVLRSELLLELKRLVRTQPGSNKVTPLIGLRQEGKVRSIISASPSLQTFEFHKIDHVRVTPVIVMREVHRLVTFLIGQIAENINHSYVPAMNGGLRILRTLLRFFDTKLTSDPSVMDAEDEIRESDQDTTSVSHKEALGALATLRYYVANSAHIPAAEYLEFQTHFAALSALVHPVAAAGSGSGTAPVRA
jgi:hypothetical protein